MSTQTPDAEFMPNEFYERLIVMRESSPTAFASFGVATLAALVAYEKAKRQADSEQEGSEK
ncbi:MAG: hypothetical protein M3R15_24615 [Acidobacteriota bacterium]|nr:hypothetical protein [Acidobacteriota bacterium]